MTKVIMMKGLPASGKSTLAKEQVSSSNGRMKRVNKDDLRAMIDAGTHSKDKEKQIVKIRNRLVNMWLEDGFNVVVDDTNFAPEHEHALREIAKKHKAEFKVEFIDTPLKVCLKRNRTRTNPVPERVIREMYTRYVKQPPVEIEWDNSKLPCIICDIDGTLAHMVGRGPHDYARVGEDKIDLTVRHLLHVFTDEHKIILLSGRKDNCREETIKWLEKHNVPFDELHMRVSSDNRKDSIVKRELYDKFVQPYYNTLFVLDDRNQVVDMWRDELGLKCLQVAEGDF